MATYAQLLVNAGGGVITPAARAKQGDDAQVIIGLGGTGGDCVKKVKYEVYRQLEPDDLKAVVPEYKNIRYLVIDSDSSTFKSSQGEISAVNIDTEFLKISNTDIRGVFANKEALRTRRELDWLSYDKIEIDDAADGAGGIRQVGRFLLVNQAELVYQRIKSTIQAACLGCTGGLDIHICSGLSGGTGSGTFLDVCYMVKKAVRELGKSNSHICGYFFLPDVNLAKPEVAADATKTGFIKKNGYAALKELDYCMSFGKNGDSFKMNYGNFQIDMNEQPVNLCYLVSATNQEGVAIPNGYDYAMHVVTDFIVSFMADVTANNGTDKSTFTLDGHISNLIQMRNQIALNNGAEIPYNTLGASVAEIPLVEIATYVGSKLFEKYDLIFERNPLESERDDFMKQNHLTYDEIRKAFTKGCINEVDFSHIDLDQCLVDGKFRNGKLIEAVEKVRAHNHRIIETNAKQFSEDLKDYFKPDDSVSLISRTFAALVSQYSVNMSYGPVYASRILMGNHNQNIFHYVEGLLEQNKRQLEYALRQEENRKEDLDIALERAKKMHLGNRKDRLKKYEEALNAWYNQEFWQEYLSKLQTVLEKYKKQITSLQTGYFSMLEQVMHTLKETFQVNMKDLMSEENNNSYHWKILSVKDDNVKSELNRIVESSDLRQVFYTLMTKLSDNYKEWIANDSNKITKLITEFIVKEFNTIAERTIVSYLEDVYQTTDPAALADKIKNNIIQEHLEKKSEPMFWKNTNYTTTVGMQNILTVPHASKPIIDAAGSYIMGKQDFQLRLSYIGDKISAMRFYSGFPLYAYQGLQNLEETYEGDTRPGRHLFERRSKNHYEKQEFYDAAIDWNDYLPSPIPKSLGESSERIRNRNKELLAMFEKAENLEIIKQSNNKYYILNTEPLDVEELIEEKGGIYSNGILNENKIAVILDELEKKKKEMLTQASQVWIQTVLPVNSSERTVTLDFFLKSGKLIQLVSDELKKRETIEAAIQRIKEEYEESLKSKMERKAFFKALFTQVLDYGNTISFSYEEFGMNKTFLLQDSTMPLGASGAYQAFLTFVDMNNTPEGESIKSKINAKANERFDGKEYIQLNKAYVDKLMGIMPMRIDTCMISYGITDANHMKIKTFYEELMKELTIYKQMLFTL